VAAELRARRGGVALETRQHLGEAGIGLRPRGVEGGLAVPHRLLAGGGASCGRVAGGLVHLALDPGQRLAMLLVARSPLALRAVHAARGLEIDAATAAPRWDGEPVDYGLAVQALLGAEATG
jgi:hypothetical protein